MNTKECETLRDIIETIEAEAGRAPHIDYVWDDKAEVRVQLTLYIPKKEGERHE